MWSCFLTFSDPKDPIAIERLNLMNMAKLSIKGLIESALNLGRTLDSDYAPLQQFFVVMEHCLKHGLKSKCSWPFPDYFKKFHTVHQTHESHVVSHCSDKSSDFTNPSTFKVCKF